jgi:hypothetical protein
MDSSHVSLEDPSNTIWFFPLVPASEIECHAAILHITFRTPATLTALTRNIPPLLVGCQTINRQPLFEHFNRQDVEWKKKRCKPLLLLRSHVVPFAVVL